MNLVAGVENVPCPAFPANTPSGGRATRPVKVTAFSWTVDLRSACRTTGMRPSGCLVDVASPPGFGNRIARDLTRLGMQRGDAIIGRKRLGPVRCRTRRLGTCFTVVPNSSVQIRAELPRF